MLDLELLKRFYVVAQSKNITHAAKKLNIVQSALSKSIAAFEQQLKVSLFSRTRKGLELNSKGLELYEYAQKMLEETYLFEKKFYEDDKKIQGDFKILTFPYVGNTFLMSLLKDFMREHTDIKVSILVDSEHVIPTEADVAIGHYLENYPDLIQNHLLSLESQLFASKDYLKTYGTPEKPADLNKHFIISYEGNAHYSTSKSNDLALTVGASGTKPRKPNLAINSLQGLINAVESGYGIAQLPCFPSIIQSDLEVVLPSFKSYDKKLDLYYTYRKNRGKSCKIKALHDYLKKRLNN